MGKTVESFRIALEGEINRWSGFARALRKPYREAFDELMKLSKITAKLKDTVDITPLLGRFQKLGFVKIVFNPSIDDEPVIQITEKVKQQVMELLISLQHTG